MGGRWRETYADGCFAAADGRGGGAGAGGREESASSSPTAPPPAKKLPVPAPPRRHVLRNPRSQPFARGWNRGFLSNSIF